MNINYTHRHYNLHNAHDDWYWETYHKHLQDVENNPDGKYRYAYEKTEEEYFTKFGTNRFSSYESFRVMKHRRTKKATPPGEQDQSL